MSGSSECVWRFADHHAVSAFNAGSKCLCQADDTDGECATELESLPGVCAGVED